MAGVAAVTAAPARVSYFDHGQVKSAFAKGAVLFDASDKYMVHASRREQPGMAEIHTKDADIIYVLDGTATFVTGGESVDSKTVAPEYLSSAKEMLTRKLAGDRVTAYEMEIIAKDGGGGGCGGSNYYVDKVGNCRSVGSDKPWHDPSHVSSVLDGISNAASETKEPS